ncbi:MAG: hypothetical protein IKR47_04065 [Lachnospiraceae bacterium]|nr:hypothetical protein [Lachnospiraceae bacterium]
MRRKVLVTAVIFASLVLTACTKETAAPENTAEPAAEEAVTNDAADQAEEAATDDAGAEADTSATDAADAADAGAENAGLPPYKYTGSDPYLAQIIDYQLTEIAPMYAEAEVFIPEPHVLLVDEKNPADIKVIGNFWIMGYDLDGTVLMTQCGGEMPAVFHFEKDEADGSVHLKAQDFVEVAGDGAQYAKDIKKFCEGYDGLEEQFYGTDNGKGEANTQTRIEFIRQYVSDNNLDITAFQDYGWDPVSIE